MGKLVKNQSQTTIFDAEKESNLNQFEESLTKLKEKFSKFGLTSNQSKVYIFLGKYGTKTASEVNKTLKLPRTETYQILTSLQNKGIVEATFQHPIKFTALPLNSAIKSMLDVEKERISKLEIQKNEVEEIWNSITIKNNQTNANEDKFQVLQNENQINSKIKDMILNPGNTMILGSNKDFANFYHDDLFDNVDLTLFRFLTPTKDTIQLFDNLDKSKIRIYQMDERLCFVVKDDQVLFFTKNHKSKVTSAMWTNSNAMIYSKKLLFELLWDRAEK